MVRLLSWLIHIARDNTQQREDAYKHFRFTNKTTKIAITAAVIFTVSIYWLASQQDVCMLLVQYLIRNAQTFHPE